MMRGLDLVPDSVDVEASIDAMFDAAASMLDTGEMSEGQFQYLDRAARTWGAGNPSARSMFARYLRAKLAAPATIGVTIEQATEDCYCDGGMVLTDDGGHGLARPCERCNADAWRLWARGHFRSGHSCGECAPGRRRRGRDTSHADEQHASRVEDQAADEKDLLF